ncbi:hypothetical protein [Maricaulis sp.]|uniref:hypothetical protein n=1 Tax=Maricaulis sp. TaxID=1486257 RepID=UPI003A93CD94
MAIQLGLLAVACGEQPRGQHQVQSAPVNASEPVQNLPENPSIEAEVVEVSSNLVRFTITTNLPLPIEVMVDVSLSGLAPDDTWVGHQSRVSLVEPVTVIDLDISQASQPLPSGEYEAEVSFYPRWGAAGNPTAQGAPEMHWSDQIALGGSGESRNSATRRNELRSWVIGNVIVGTPWDEGRFSARLGEFEKYPSTLSHHDAYYFAAADMTIIVNRIDSEVQIWRMGRALR